MAQVNTDLNKGTITYSLDEIDLKQEFFIKSFDQMTFVFSGLIDLLKNSNNPDDSLLKNLVDLSTRHKEYSDMVNSIKSEKEKNLQPAKQMTSKELKKYQEKLLKDAIKKEQKKQSR